MVTSWSYMATLSLSFWFELEYIFIVRNNICVWINLPCHGGKKRVFVYFYSRSGFTFIKSTLHFIEVEVDVICCLGSFSVYLFSYALLCPINRVVLKPPRPMTPSTFAQCFFLYTEIATVHNLSQSRTQFCMLTSTTMPRSTSQHSVRDRPYTHCIHVIG